MIRDREDADKPQPVRLLNLSGDPDRVVWQVVNIWQASDAYRRLLHHPGLAAQLAPLARAGGAEELRVFHDQVQYKPAQDGWCETGGIRIRSTGRCWVPRMRRSPRGWALDDVDEDNGCMSMVPGSHEWGDQIDHLHRQRDQLGLNGFGDLPRQHEGREVEVVSCPVEKGGVHFHHSLTWHGSPANRSGCPRRAVAIHLMCDRTVYEPSKPHPMEEFIQAVVGERIEGDAFPPVWSKGEHGA